MKCIGLPGTIKLRNRAIATGDLFRLAYPIRLSSMEPVFNMSKSKISFAFIMD